MKGYMNMKFCPHCGHEMTAETKFCPDCGKSLVGSSNFLSLPKKFWMTFIGAVGVLIFSLLDWIDMGYGISFNLFNLWGKLKDSGLNWLLGGSQEFQSAKTFMIVLSIVLIAAFVLLAVSLAKHQSKERATLAYWGFGLTALVPAAFMISILAVTEGDGIEALTIFPLLTLVVAVIGLIFLVKKPVITHSEHRSALFLDIC
jgi:CDP-diglyceride synthetase